jgi:hypothetical protein
LMSRHGALLTCLALPLLEMDHGCDRCEMQDTAPHLTKQRYSPLRLLQRVGKKYDTYHGAATAMPG